MLFVAVLGAGERMVARFPLSRVELEHREIDHPQWPPGFFGQAALVAHLLPKRAHVGGGRVGLVGAEEDDVAVLGRGSLQDRIERTRVQVLDDRRLQPFGALRALVHLDPGEPLRAKSLRILAVSIELAAGERTTAGHAQPTDTAAW